MRLSCLLRSILRMTDFAKAQYTLWHHGLIACLIVGYSEGAAIAEIQQTATVQHEATSTKEVVDTLQQIKDLGRLSTLAELPEQDRGVLQRAAKDAEAQLHLALKQNTDVTLLQNIADKRFEGFNFGVALGVVTKAGKRDLVQSASQDSNGIVRIERDNNTTANLLLESHYFFTPHRNFFGVDSKNWGHGPFVAVQPGTENIIQSVGVGWMIGFKRSSIVAADLARDRGDSFNIGIGVMVNPNAQVLGDGMQKNQPLPPGETSPRFRKTTEMGWLIAFSYSF